MSVSTEARVELLNKYSRKKGDTGSPEVQIALITQRINSLTEHLQAHSKDNHSRRGLLKLVSQRRKLLDYLKRRLPEIYNNLITGLGLRR